MTYAQYLEARRDETIAALKRFAKGDKRALIVGRARLDGLKHHYKDVRHA